LNFSCAVHKAHVIFVLHVIFLSILTSLVEICTRTSPALYTASVEKLARAWE